MEHLLLQLSQWEPIRTYLFGQVKFVDLLAILMLCDIVTGVMKAIKNKRLRSRSALYGYFRKIGIFTLMAVANIIDQVFGLNGYVAGATITYFILYEIVSIVENCAQLGLNVPSVITDKLHVIQEENKEEKKNDL
ncbi:MULTISPECIES: phage holin family protein [Priestia]|uniref:phage holin family protein n=1 Tax=Priestia TaxID=2800373 RepID=UPI0007877ADD|nr:MULTISPECIES: phage holin family protein [Priestia]SCB73762.1 toxin secretion/phage lysis holin [Priestia flexa]